jgi:uncharacterized protein (DUF885 family)
VRHWIGILLLLSGWAGASASQEGMTLKDYESGLRAVISDHKASDTDRFHRLLTLDWEFQLALHPTFASSIGERRFGRYWDDYSDEAEKMRRRAREAFAKALSTIREEALSASDRVSYRMLQRSIALDRAGDPFPERWLPINQMSGIQRELPATIRDMPRASLRDYDDIIARLETMPRPVEQVLKAMQEGLKAGVTPARTALLDVPRQIQALIPEDPWKSPFLEPFLDFPADFTPVQQRHLRSRAADIYRSRLVPAWLRLLRFVQSSYLPGARENIAFTSLPQGKAWYALRVKQHTTTDLSPEAIHDIGLKEVARLDKAMAAIKEKVGFSGDMPAFFHHLRTSPKFFYEREEDLVRGYRDIAKRIDGELPALFVSLPRLTYGVKPIPANEAKAQTTAYYSPGSLKAGRAGFYFVNTYALNTRPKWEMPALSLHEAMPGHHLQISLAQELDGLPMFRRYASYTAFVEGWALYAEKLGYPMGIYRDEYERFGQLTYEMWRAVRLVVDTGMHQMGWSRQQAIDFFLAHAPKTRHDVEVEIDRYIAWPGQALAYKMGELKISALRKEAEERLGERFDIREFHKVVLENGAVPLDVLEAQVREWMDAQSAGSTR